MKDKIIAKLRLFEPREIFLLLIIIATAISAIFFDVKLVLMSSASVFIFSGVLLLTFDSLHSGLSSRRLIVMFIYVTIGLGITNLIDPSRSTNHIGPDLNN